jgi:hypothetical protein
MGKLNWLFTQTITLTPGFYLLLKKENRRQPKQELLKTTLKYTKNPKPAQVNNYYIGLFQIFKSSNFQIK